MAYLNVKKLLTKIVKGPIVIKTGTTSTVLSTGVSCHWKFKIWSDGRCEMWGVIDSGYYHMTQAYGYAYYNYYTLSWPSYAYPGQTFTPDFISVQRGAGDGYDLIHLEVSSSNSDTFSFYAIDTYSSSRAFEVTVYATGFVS